jgi:hypothetical protein
MKVPIIKHLTQFASDQKIMWLKQLKFLESLTELSSIKEEKLDVINNFKHVMAL